MGMDEKIQDEKWADDKIQEEKKQERSLNLTLIIPDVVDEVNFSITKSYLSRFLDGLADRGEDKTVPFEYPLMQFSSKMNI
jgi:hypothetical protein